MYVPSVNIKTNKQPDLYRSDAKQHPSSLTPLKVGFINKQKVFALPVKLWLEAEPILSLSAAYSQL